MNEKPLERLNYYNGQRLEAADFKTEQDYHMRTRRWLNKSLYSAGIARGLEVSKTSTSASGSPLVTVSPGLALDNEGREMILFEEIQIEVCSYAGTKPGEAEGNYLVIEYTEETIAFARGGCAVRTPGSSALKSSTNWGGPSRIQAQVKFSWVPFVPHPSAGQVVLARVELNSSCSEVLQIDAGARHYIGASSMATVRQYALEGEREVAFIPKDSFPAPAYGQTDNRLDVEVVGRIYFHIRGRQSGSVTLHLRAEEFSPLCYTELGKHTHVANVSSSVADHHITVDDISHVHDLSGVITDEEKGDDQFFDGVNWFNPHEHWVNAKIGNLGSDSNKNLFKFDLSKSSDAAQLVDNDVNLNIYMGKHRHRLIMDGSVDTHVPAKTPNPDSVSFKEIVLTHSNLSSTPTIDPTGVLIPGRNGDPLTFVNYLQVFLGAAGGVSNDFTDDIKQQLADMYPANWSVGGAVKSLGDGTGTHELAINGTGAIRLDYLQGMTFAEGEYCIELKIDKEKNKTANGGKIHYNLYIE